MPTLPGRVSSERLLLRQWELTDVAAIGEAIGASAEHLRPWMPWVAAEPLTDADRAELVLGWRDQWNDGTEAHYGVFADGSIVGSGGLMSRIGPGTLEIGYWIHVDHVRQGYATEVARVLTTTALDAVGVDRVEIRHDLANVASAGIAKALGYERGPDLHRQPVAPAETGTDWTWVMTGRRWSAGALSASGRERSDTRRTPRPPDEWTE